MANRQAQADADGGQDTPMILDLYSLAGAAAVALVAGLVGMRVIKDEHLLRRKRISMEKY